MSRHRALAGAALLAISPGGVGLGEETGNAFSREPYVQLSSPDAATIVWRTEREINAEVRFGRDPGRLDGAVEGAAIERRRAGRPEFVGPVPEGSRPWPRPLHSAPKDTRQHEARVGGLAPGTVYYYAVFDGETRLTPEDDSFRFATHPVAGDVDATFWILGDSGTGEKRQEEVHAAMLGYLDRENLDLDFWLHVGDMAYEDGKDSEFQKNFFDVYAPTLRHVPVWPAMGNHEGSTARGDLGIGPYYDAYVCPAAAEAGGLPSGTEAYYSWDFGPIHFIALDSFDLDRSPEAAMAQWLRADLERTRARWLIAYWHHPPYSKGTHDSDKEKELVEMRENFMPILEAGGVDLVFTGHSHIYERSMLMDGAYSTPTVAENVILDDGDGDPDGDGPYRKLPGLVPHQGTVQFVAGHGGTSVGREGTMPVMRKIIVENGSVVARIRGDVFEAVMIDHEGGVRDRVQLVKQEGVEVARIASPRTPPPFVSPGDSLPEDHVVLLGSGAPWSYLAGNDPGEAWATPAFDAGDWEVGPGPFGDAPGEGTALPEGRGIGRRVYLRSEFLIEEEEDLSRVGLAIRYDDAFIAYANGVEFARQGVEKGRGPGAEGIGEHRPGEEEFFPIPREHIRPGPNLVAVEGHDRHTDDERYLIDPRIVRGPRRNERRRLPFPDLARTVGKRGWHYLAGRDPADASWKSPSFRAGDWTVLSDPLYYGSGRRGNDTLPDMKGAYRRVHLRLAFARSEISRLEDAGLALRWDDGFQAWLNGAPIARDNVDEKEDGSLEIERRGNFASGFFPLLAHAGHLEEENVLAVTVHNQAEDSGDFFADASVLQAWPGQTGESVPEGAGVVIGGNDAWKYLAGRDPEPGWAGPGFDEAGWFPARTPIGHGLAGQFLATRVDDMPGNYSRIYLRNEFRLRSPSEAENLGLAMQWSDSFIAYLNGIEVLRVGVEEGSGAGARGFHEKTSGFRGAARPRFFSLARHASLLRPGGNTIALETHAADPDQSWFFIAPTLVRNLPRPRIAAVPDVRIDLIPPSSTWRYAFGIDPPPGWNRAGFDSSAWKEGAAGFGYGDGDDNTKLGEMEGRYPTLYLRREFVLPSRDGIEDLGLAVRWDDGFIAYLNGREVMRQNVGAGSGPAAADIESNEARANHLAFSLADHLEGLAPGRHVLAIEGHNTDKDSSDFTLDPFLFHTFDSGLPKHRIELVKRGADWSYLAGRDPGEGWTALAFDGRDWPSGPAGFGYEDEDDATELPEMRDRYRRVYLRHRFRVPENATGWNTGLAIRYDDAFIAYLNGVEFARAGIAIGRGSGARGISKHEAGRDYLFFALAPSGLLRPGENILAIEGHNEAIDSSDFTLDPYFIRVLSR